MPLNDWMSAYGNRTLGEMILPGSHDAGTNAQESVLHGFAATASNSITQNLTIAQQLAAGTRFFDLRLKAKDGAVVAHHTTAGIGAYGGRLDDSIQAAAVFCRNNPSEIVILRISHTATSTDADKIVHDSSFVNGKSELCTARGNLATQRLSDLKAWGGGLICVFASEHKMVKKYKLFGEKVAKGTGSDFAHAGKVDQGRGIHPFAKYKGQAHIEGLATCGCYKGTNSLSKVVGNALKGQYDHVANHAHGDHLWQVYWQKTYVNPVHRTGIEAGTTKGTSLKVSGDKVKFKGGTQAATQHMLDLMKGHRYQGEEYVLQQKDKKAGKVEVLHSTLGVRQRRMPNIISYDFVNPATNQEIIALNVEGVQIHEADA
jgi:hypothetical protein